MKTQNALKQAKHRGKLIKQGLRALKVNLDDQALDLLRQYQVKHGLKNQSAAITDLIKRGAEWH